MASQEREEEEGRVDVVAYAADLMFASRIRGAARSRGVALGLVQRASELPERVRALSPRLVIIDLDARAGDGVAAIRELKGAEATRDVRLVAFASHRAVDRIEAARAAGADRVLARSAFVRELPTLLQPE